MNIMISIIWILISILQSVQSQYFIQPNATGFYLANEPVPVAVIFTLNSQFVFATMTCGSITSNYVNLTISWPNTTILPPNDYVGPCTVDGRNDLAYTLAPVHFQIVGILSVTSPSTSSPLTKYPAGSALPVSWIYTPPAPSNTTVTLTCETSVTGASETVSAETYTDLTINPDSYGSICNLSLASSNPFFVLPSSIFLSVSQQLSFSSPISGISYPVSYQQILLRLNTAPYASISTLVPVVLQCGSSNSSNSVSVTTNYYLVYPIPSGYSGLCTLTPVPTSPDQDYLVVPNSTLSFYLKYNLTFASITSSPVAGGAFSFQMSINPLEFVSQTVNVSLVCANATEQTWYAVPVNTPYSTALNSDVPTGIDCYLQTPADSEYFFQADSSSFTISPKTILITSPITGAKIPSGSTFSVTWTSSTTQADPSFNVSLACSGFSTLTLITTLFTASISIPSTYYSASCIVSVADTGSNTAQVSVAVTQILSFTTPTTGSVIALNTASIPVKLITSGANIYADIAVSFQCTDGSSGASDFAANTDSLAQSVSSSQIGSCNLTIISAPAYLVYPSPSVSFILQYTLTFTILPTTLYLNQSFTIQINTTTPASTPPSVILYLICPPGLVSDTWPGVLINQPNSLLLSSTTPLDSCYFKVNGSTS